MAPVTPAGSGSRPPRRTRHQVTLSPRVVERLRQRGAATVALGYRTSLSAELERCVDQADSNLRNVRHAIGNDLAPAAAAVTLIRRELILRHRVDPADLEPISAALARVMSRLEATAPTPGATTSVAEPD